MYHQLPQILNWLVKQLKLADTALAPISIVLEYLHSIKQLIAYVCVCNKLNLQWKMIIVLTECTLLGIFNVRPMRIYHYIRSY